MATKKNKRFIIVFMLWIIALLVGLLIVHLTIPIVLNGVKYDIELDDIDYHSGEKKYVLRIYHWHKGEIGRYKSYFGQTQKQVDSIKIIEDKIDLKYKKLRNKN